MNIEIRLPSLTIEEPINCIQVNAEGRVLYECPTCSKQWAGEKVLDTLVQEAQKRILEKAIERLEWKKNDYMTIVESGSGTLKLDLAMMQKYYRQGIDQAIAELKSLLGEVDT